MPKARPAAARGKQRPGRSRGTRRFAWGLVACGVALVPWTVFLTRTLPARNTGHFYNVSWTVFDVVLLICLILTGVAALRRSRRTSPAAAATGTLLFVDAWFDVTGAGSRSDFWVAFLLAALVEIPIGVACWRLALQAAAAPGGRPDVEQAQEQREARPPRGGRASMPTGFRR